MKVARPINMAELALWWRARLQIARARNPASEWALWGVSAKDLSYLSSSKERRWRDGQKVWGTVQSKQLEGLNNVLSSIW